jgi:hypothetical protein
MAFFFFFFFFSFSFVPVLLQGVTSFFQVRYFRNLRAQSVIAAARKKALREEQFPRPVPKVAEHVEDILFKNGLRFVRPGDERILGVTREGISIPNTKN